MNVRRPLIIDTDPGVDDAIAILMLLGHPSVDPLAITAVGGNVGLQNTVRNALCLVELANRADVPVCAGAASPLIAPLHTAEDVHGASGLAHVLLPEPATRPTEEDASDLIWRLAHEQPGEVTVLALGPLTNIAKAFLRYPELPKLLRELIIMGGAILGGNATLQAEFNIFVDPEAARIVFRSGVKLSMVPLDVCSKTTLSLSDCDTIEAVGSNAALVAGQLVRYIYNLATTRFHHAGAPVYDAIAAALLLKPSLFTLEQFNVEIELRGVHTRGRTVVDYYGFTKKPANCAIPVLCDKEGYLQLLCDCVGALP